MSNGKLEDMPLEVWEGVLRFLPFAERVAAMGVCRAWRQQLSQPGLVFDRLVLTGQQPSSSADRAADTVCTRRTGLLRRWLQRHLPRLQQLHCNGALPWMQVQPVFANMAPASAMSLKALRLDGTPEPNMTAPQFRAVVSACPSLAELVLLGLYAIPYDEFLDAVMQLPKLQDLVISTMPTGDEISPEDVWGSCQRFAQCCPNLRTLALGNNRTCGMVFGADDAFTNSIICLPALETLALQDVWMPDAPREACVAALPGLKRLTLSCPRTTHGSPHGFEGQLTVLSKLECLQLLGYPEPLRLPVSLTKVVMQASGLGVHPGEPQPPSALGNCLSSLENLQHLALYRLDWLNLPPDAVFSAASRLPHLKSLHLVRCDLSSLPQRITGFTALQLLDLRANTALHVTGEPLASADLKGLTACRQLDLSIGSMALSWPKNNTAAMQSIAAMPALEQLAMPSPRHVCTYKMAQELSAYRECSAPQISVVCDGFEESHRWGSVDPGQVPREEAASEGSSGRAWDNHGFISLPHWQKMIIR